MSSPPDPRAVPPTDEFLGAARAAGIEFERDELERLASFLRLLLDANNRFNLTAITDPAQAWMKHIYDSLTLLPVLNSLGVKSVLDVGSGGGMPGIPLAITMPEIHFTLLEATGKKAHFLEETARALALENVAVIHERAERVGQDHHHHRERYDAVIARAVGKLPVLLELTVPLAAVGGHVLAIKGERARAEIAESGAALRLLGARVAEVIPAATGTIVVIEKTERTPRTYPRLPGEPARAPLGAARQR